MNEFALWAKGSRCYLEFKVVDDMQNLWSWALGFKCYE